MRLQAVALALCVAAVAAPSVAQNAPPTRKTGWWDISVRVMGVTSKIQVCTDPATEKLYPSVAGNPGDDCTPAVTTRTAPGWTFETSCKTPQGPARTTGTVQGDFQSGYKVAAATQAPGVPFKVPVTIEGRYVGDCPSPRVAGDMVMGGKVTNLLKSHP
jgi:hypothetical protein